MFNLYEQEILQGKSSLRQVLARYFLGASVGDHVLTVRDLARVHGSSIGAVSSALTALERDGVISLEKRGRRGTILERRSLGQLWAAAEREPIIIALPLPSTRRYEGLATAIKTLLTKVDIEAFFIFVRGSRQRLRALKKSRCHVAVMSGFAFENLRTVEEMSALDLPVGSFVSEHRVLYASHIEGKDEVHRVAVDEDSVDQKLLSELEFEGSEVEFVPGTYIQLARLLEEGYADAAVWSADEVAEHRQIPGFRDHPLSESVLRRVAKEDTKASFLIRTADNSVQTVIEEGLDAASLMRIEEEVTNGRIVPEY